MKDLTAGKEWKVILQFAFPMLLGNVFQQLYNVVDSIIVGNFLGKEALASVGASFPVIFVMISLVIGITMGITIVISQYYGAKNFVKVKSAIDTMNIFLFFTSIFLSVLAYFLSEPIFRLIKLPEELMADAISYFRWFTSGFILMFGYNTVAAILRGLGDSKTPLYFLIISTFVNIVLDILFVVVLKFGVASVASATVIANGVAFLTAILYLNKKHEMVRIKFRNLVFDKEIFRQSIRIGLPSGIQQSFVALGMMALYWIVNDFGTDAIAAYSVAHRLDSFAGMPAMTLGSALSTFVGQNLGANKMSRAKKGMHATWIISIITSLVVFLCMILFKENFMAAFNQDTRVIEIGASYLMIVSGFYVVFSSMFTINGVLRGAGATIVPMFSTLIALWVLRIPLSYYMSQNMGTDGIWWGIPIAWAFGFMMSYIYYLSGKWKNKGVVKYD
ncbi:MAG TPA: MATE family efflux transporter [Bacteroidetes bacterium]|nr:MATE family efflux transporter [Bacteroidota bacterium]